MGSDCLKRGEKHFGIKIEEDGWTWMDCWSTVESSCELTLDPLNLFSKVGEMWSLNENEGGLDRFRGLGKPIPKIGS